MPENNPIDSTRHRFLSEVPLGAISEETVPLLAARGRILAERLMAAIDDPPYCRAIVEGYVVCVDDLAGVSETSPLELEITGEIAVGQGNVPGLESGKTLSVTTGSYIPEGNYAVLRAWDVEKKGRRIRICGGAKKGANIEVTGEIRTKGSPLLNKGHQIQSEDVFLAASQGLISLKVARRPRVALFSSGNEVIAPTAPASMGTIWDCNQYGLSSLIEEAGGIPLFKGIMKDDFEYFKNQLSEALASSDMVVISGGTVAENRDFTADLLDAVGPPGALVKGIPMRSGKPIVLGLSGKKPIVCVAGHPPEAARGFMLFAQPAIQHLMGKED